MGLPNDDQQTILWFWIGRNCKQNSSSKQFQRFSSTPRPHWRNWEIPVSELSTSRIQSASSPFSRASWKRWPGAIAGRLLAAVVACGSMEPNGTMWHLWKDGSAHSRAPPLHSDSPHSQPQVAWAKPQLNPPWSMEMFPSPFFRQTLVETAELHGFRGPSVLHKLCKTFGETRANGPSAKSHRHWQHIWKMAKRKVLATWNENCRAHVDTCGFGPRWSRWVALPQLATDIFRIFVQHLIQLSLKPPIRIFTQQTKGLHTMCQGRGQARARRNENRVDMDQWHWVQKRLLVRSVHESHVEGIKGIQKVYSKLVGLADMLTSVNNILQPSQKHSPRRIHPATMAWRIVQWFQMAWHSCTLQQPNGPEMPGMLEISGDCLMDDLPVASDSSWNFTHFDNFANFTVWWYGGLNPSGKIFVNWDDYPQHMGK